MKSHRKELWMEVPGRRAFINITGEIEAALRDSGIREGLCLVTPMHITASVFINDDERGLHADYEAFLERIAPHAPVDQYRHNRTGEDNTSDVVRSLEEVSIPGSSAPPEPRDAAGRISCAVARADQGRAKRAGFAGL